MIGQTNTDYNFIYILALEPKFAQVTKRLDSQASIDLLVLPRRCITPAVHPHLNDFTGKLNFPYKSRPTQLRISKPS